MKEYELIEHYNFYVDNCTNEEIPLDFVQWKKEYEEIIKNML